MKKIRRKLENIETKTSGFKLKFSYTQSKKWFMIVQKQIQTKELNLVIAMYEMRTR